MRVWLTLIHFLSLPTDGCCQLTVTKWQPMGLHHPLDGDTNLKYKLLCFLTPNKKILSERHQLLTGIDAAI